MNELKYCKFCDKEKPVKDFCKSGLAIKNICRECQNKKQKKQYRDAKILTKLEEWLKETRINSAFIDEQTIMEVQLKIQELEQGSDNGVKK